MRRISTKAHPSVLSGAARRSAIGRWALGIAAAISVLAATPAWSQVDFTKSFTNDPASAGGTVTLEYTITNNSGGAVAGLSFTDNYDAVISGLQTSGTPSITLCAGASISFGASTFTLLGVALIDGQSCVIDVTLQIPVSAVAGIYPSTSSDLSSLVPLGTAAAGASDNLVIGTGTPPGFSKAFSPSSIAVGQTSTLTFTIDNTGSAFGAGNLDFTDNLPTGMLVATAPNDSTTCSGGTITAVAATGTVSYSGGTVSAGASCTVQVDVTAGVPGGLSNTSGDLTSTLGNSGPASATLSVSVTTLGFSAAFSPDTIRVGDTTTLTYTIDNSANAAPGLNLSFSDTLPSGLELAPAPNASTTCIGGTLTANAGATTFSYSGGTVLSLSSCTVQVDFLATANGTYDYVSGELTTILGSAGTATATLTVGYSVSRIITQTKAVIRNFMRRRADLITVDDPDLTKRLAEEDGRPIRAYASYTPDGTQMRFATSLSKLRGAIADYRAQHSDEAKALASMGLFDAIRVPTQPPRFDIWTEGRFTSYRDTAGGENDGGTFGILYLGAEWRVRPSLALGVMGQVDRTKQEEDSTGIGAKGTGWMAGPYVAGRVAGGVLFQLRGAYGTSDNKVSPFGTYDDSFKTHRWLVSGRIKRQFRLGNWRISPNAGVIYFQEKQFSYVDSNDIRIPEQDIALGRLTFGPEIAYRGALANGGYIEPVLGITGVWDFVGEDKVVNGAGVGSNTLRARLTGGVKMGTPGGTLLEASAFYDGLGDSGYEAFGGKASVVLPFGPH